MVDIDGPRFSGSGEMVIACVVGAGAAEEETVLKPLVSGPPSECRRGWS